MLFTIVTGILLFIVLPSALFYHVEDYWTYLDCVYYTFISLTTIGFGDLSNAQSVKERLGMWMFPYLGFTVVWLIFGFSFLSMYNTFLIDKLKKIFKKVGFLNVIPLVKSIPTDPMDYEGYDMSKLMHRTRSISDPCISFSTCGSHFNPDLQMARQITRGISPKIQTAVTYEKKDIHVEGLNTINDIPMAELIDLGKKCTELRRANEVLQVTNNIAEAELIALGKKCTELRKAYKSLQITSRETQSELISLRGKSQLVTEANESLMIANYEAEDELDCKSEKV